MIKDQTIKDVKARMTKTLDTVRHELGTVRTGKASPSLLDQVRVEAYGTPQPLKQVSTINVPEPRLITLQPWDKSLVGEIMKAIQKDDLGLNPQIDGNMIRIPIPALNEERRKELVKHCKKVVEDGKVAVRNIRRDSNDHLKKLEKEKQVTEDDLRDALDQVQKLTDSFCHDMDTLLHAKEKEVMEV